jgi:hypothetical protein
MQLQLEPMALTIFHALREVRVCPVLSELLQYYEKDEARHVGLGVQLLPTLLADMPIGASLAFTAYSFHVTTLSIWVLKDLEDDLRALGVDPRRVAVLGKSKQMIALEELWATAPGTKNEVTQQLGNVFDAISEWMWPDEHADPSLFARAKRVGEALKNGMTRVDTTLDPTENGDAIEVAVAQACVTRERQHFVRRSPRHLERTAAKMFGEGRLVAQQVGVVHARADPRRIEARRQRVALGVPDREQVAGVMTLERRRES